MAVLTAAAFISKWNARFADNTTREISEADMREFVEDIKDSFQNISGAVSVTSWKSPCAVATTGNITLSGEQTIDGVLTSGSRVLVKNQTTTSQNGIYVSAAGAWSRSTDADDAAELEGAAVGVTQGTTQQNTVWLQTSDNITLGSTAIQWQQIGFGGGTQTLASVLTTGNDAGGLAITNLDDPTNAQDAATKAYVDAEVAGAGGITNSAANNELMKSDGTNAVGSGAYSTSTGVGIGTSSPDRKFHVEIDDASTNTTVPIQRLTRMSSGTPASGIGTSIEFELETAAGNLEVGATIEVRALDVTAASEDFNIYFNTMKNGNPPTERFRYDTALDSLFLSNNLNVTAHTISNSANIGDQTNGNFSVNSNGNTTVQKADSSTNAIVRGFTLNHAITGSGTPAIGIGIGMSFACETSNAGNTETGANIDCEFTDVSAGSEDADLVFKTMAGGATASEAVRIKSDKSTSFTGPAVLPSYTVAGVPAAASYTGGMIYVTNETGGAVPAFSDGTNWRRVTDRNIIA